MTTPEAAHIAEALRTATKSQNLNGAGIADAVERLTGQRPNAMQVSRWLSAGIPMIRVNPDLATVCRALGLDPVELACDAVREAAQVVPPRPEPGDYADLPVLDIDLLGAGTNPYQQPDCQHPDIAGWRCTVCCDTCNSDGHLCVGCDEPVAHNAIRCFNCNEHHDSLADDRGAA